MPSPADRPLVLKTLPASVRSRLEESFRRGDQPSVETDDLAEELKIGRVVNLEAFHEVVDEAKRRFPARNLTRATIGSPRGCTRPSG